MITPAPRVGARRRGAGAVAVLGVLVVTVAGCGSQLSPEEVRGSGQILVNGATVGDGGVAGAGLPETVPGSGEVVPGTSTVPGATVPGTGTTGTTGDGGSAPGAVDPSAPADTRPESEENEAGGGGEAASCDGFDNDQPGIDASSITLANASDISGPVPGIFESARLGARAYVAYFNSSEKVCGHTIKLLELDSRADAGADQQAYARACAESFGAIGSMSAFDSGGASTAAECGLPEVRSTTVNPERAACSTCFSAQSVSPGLVPRAMPTYMSKIGGSATDHVALLYINAGAAPVNAASFKKGWEASGWTIDYFQPIDVSEFNFAPYVQQMKDKGIELVYYLGPYQNTVKLQQTMAQQGFEPKIYLQDSTIYDANYVEQAGQYADGAYAYSNIALFDDTRNAEMRLYRAWLETVSPGADPNFYGLYAWSAARLFLENAIALGGELDRAAMVQSLSKVRNWTSNGLHSPQDVGGKTTGKCQKIIRYTGGAWTQVSPGDYLCDSLVNTGVGN